MLRQLSLKYQRLMPPTENSPKSRGSLRENHTTVPTDISKATAQRFCPGEEVSHKNRLLLYSLGKQTNIQKAKTALRLSERV